LTILALSPAHVTQAIPDNIVVRPTGGKARRIVMIEPIRAKRLSGAQAVAPLGGR